MTDLSAHRVLFNGDCNFLLTDTFDPREPGDTSRFSVQVFRDYLDVLADNGVDTYLCNGNGQHPWYPSKRLAHVLTGYRRGDRSFTVGQYPPCDQDFPPAKLNMCIDRDLRMLNRMLDMQEAGADWFAEVAAHCRRRGIRPWASIRMNDAHGANSWDNSYFNCALQRQQRYRLRGAHYHPGRPDLAGFQVMNYEHAEVRAYMLDLIRDALESYGYEGLELDFTRIEACCEPPAGQQTIDTITAWMGEVRQVVDAHAARQGKPCPLGIRAPIHYRMFRDHGLDLMEIARRGLIDFLAVANSWQTSWDVDYAVMGQDMGPTVTLYGVIEDAPNWLFAQDAAGKERNFRRLSASAELVRGNAANKLAGGADAIYAFNYFCTDHPGHRSGAGLAACYPALRGIADLAHLRGRDKHYCLATQQGYWMRPGFESGEQLPARIDPQRRRDFRLTMCAEPAAGMQLTVQVVLERQAQGPDLAVSFNDCWPSVQGTVTDQLLFPTGHLTNHLPEHVALNYRFPASTIREGWNRILVFNERQAGEDAATRLQGSINVLSVEVGVKG